MKIHTPFDFWRAGVTFWIAACETQIALGTQMFAMMRPARPVHAKATVPSRAAPARNRRSAPARAAD